MMLPGTFSTSGLAYMPYKASTAKSHNSTYLNVRPLPSKLAIRSIRSSFRPLQTPLSCTYRGISSISALPLRWSDDAFSCSGLKTPRKSHFPLSPTRAFKDEPYHEKISPSSRAFKNVPFPSMAEKPKWWWRSLACLPYLIPLHLAWFFAGESYHLRPLVEKSDFFSNPYNNFLQRMPSWLLMAYTLSACFYILKRKEWPRVFRFHVIMAILLENLMHTMIIVYGWLPPFIHWGNNIGTYIWAGVTLAYLVTILDCVKCALAGTYAEVPLITDAANIHLKRA